ncbi:MAG: isoaspartyl peptidase/L-asparaginase family protein [Cryomorphaceae bacterium]|nr:isoaspartyl peptidase/L-asparaginase [Flavobacteriales bacterium]
MKKFAFAIHGGAGTILKSAMTPEKEMAYRDALHKALKLGADLLEKGGSATEAVEAAVVEMENSALFNAGYGSVFTHDKSHELDASIMEGKGRKAGAVAGVKRIKNPISLCRKIMERSEHVFLIGEGAEAFATEEGEELVSESYFSTEARKQQLLKIRDSMKTQLDHSDDQLKKFGTVGAVAMDSKGNLAAATSTGGITNKRYSRVGDTAIIGSGTYAENGVCAISSTGWGEYFIRAVAAYEVAALMKYGKMTLEEASNQLVHQVIPEMGGDGGIIAVDSFGNIAMPFNTEGMYRAKVDSENAPEVSIYK